MSTDKLPAVAYFCMEYGLDTGLTIYSGGLGILAGDTMKSVSDLKLPVVGIGLLWDEGYTAQLINAAGQPEDHYLPTNRELLQPVDVEFTVPVAGKELLCRAVRVTPRLCTELYLIEPVHEADRWITKRLYGGGSEDRLAQELLLGVGGVRLLQALDRKVDVYHFNEGHAVFAGLELVRQAKGRGLDMRESLSEVRSSVVFTTHTPVKAGNEVHAIELMQRMGADCGHSASELEELGGSPFNMTVAGLRMAREANAVAELHGETARDMWKDVTGAAPIRAITNGVHVPSWQDPRIRAATVREKDEQAGNAELWQVHQRMKRELLASIEETTGIALDLDKLTVGFARRAASYKRALLIFGDTARVEKLFASGLQLVFSGKAHPADAMGKEVVAQLVMASKRWPQNVVFVENYDMDWGARLTRGVDIWLNNPRRPFEASGTSGMKAAMNGVPNLSILDGWWPEGCEHGVTGWRIGKGLDQGVEVSEEQREIQDIRDRENLYQVLETEVLPTYSDHPRWTAIMRASINMSQWKFSSDRMVQDYFKYLYRVQ
jgi:glycogen phosphorylase